MIQGEGAETRREEQNNRKGTKREEVKISKM